MANQQVEHWLQLANYDFQTAKAMFQTGRWIFVIFMCHLTIETLLKATLANIGLFPSKTHNLIRLLELSSISSEISPEHLAFIEELNPLNILTRYPEDLAKLLSSFPKDK
ncbi:MAG: HEPN domain-containing protein, partial [Deltaproteobacteria bacterium]|nr:HEPN domain-containing protein [Deltaproteobacteria bacterium]